jgi:CBS domain-containing protein
MICPRCGHDNVPGDDVCSSCLLDLAPLDQPAGQDRVQLNLTATPVRALDPRRPVTLPADTPLRDAVRVMLDEGVGTVLVLDGDDHLAGIFSERDLLLRVPDAEAAAGAVPVARYMTPRPETVRPDDTLAVALHKMDVGGYRHLPVVDGGRPVGMISVRDMIRHITRLCRE